RALAARDERLVAKIAEPRRGGWRERRIGRRDEPIDDHDLAFHVLTLVVVLLRRRVDNAPLRKHDRRTDLLARRERHRRVLLGADRLTLELQRGLRRALDLGGDVEGLPPALPECGFGAGRAQVL